jgi:glycine oxidase
MVHHTADVLVIGAGIVGCSIAYTLRKRGISVVVLERDTIGAHASSAAAGLLAPLRPLSEENALQSLLLTGAQQLTLLIPELENVSGISVGYEQIGALRLLPESMVAAVPAWVERWKHKGYSIEVLSPEEIRRCEPLLMTPADIAGAVLMNGEGQVVPGLLTQAYAQAARRLGALFCEHTEVVNLQRNTATGKVTGVYTREEFWACNQLVVAVGAWSSSFGDLLSTTFPVRPVRGELIMVRPPLSSALSASGVRHIIFDEGLIDRDFYAAPKPGGTLLLGATKAEVGFSTEVSVGGIAHLFAVATRLFPTLATWYIERMWACLRPKTLDSRPLLGPVPGWENVTIAAGHAGFGITLSAITGQMIAEWIAARHLPDGMVPFTLQSGSSGGQSTL